MNNESLPVKLILASGSKYRSLLLQRLGLPFECHPPRIDESGLEDESPLQQVERLASAKAAAVCSDYPAAVVIGSDQLAMLGDRAIGKPGEHQRAVLQLRSFSGQTIEFLTAVAVQSSATGFSETHVDRTRVVFRSLDDAEIERYLVQERPYDCAGAFKAESLGISLFRRIESDDPTGLIGLPLIRTAAMLRRAGFSLP
jgi:septum formation protein